MKVLLLAAGFGARLRPITEATPKCLVRIGKRPLLQHWLDSLAHSSLFEEVIINTHYLADEVVKFVCDYQSPISIVLSHEEKLLGPGGTLMKHRSSLLGGDFLVAHADNFSIIDWAAFVTAHKFRPSGCVGTMMTFDADAPSSCGVVETDTLGRLVEMHEKVLNPPGKLANAAVYLFAPEVFEIIDKASSKQIFDISLDIVPLLLERLLTFKNSLYHRDIGTPESLAQARRDYHSLPHADAAEGHLKGEASA